MFPFCFSSPLDFFFLSSQAFTDVVLVKPFCFLGQQLCSMAFNQHGLAVASKLRPSCFSIVGEPSGLSRGSLACDVVWETKTVFLAPQEFSKNGAYCTALQLARGQKPKPDQT